MSDPAVGGHVLVVRDLDGELDYELLHSEDCPSQPDDDFVPGGSFYTCTVADLWSCAGHEGIPDVETLAPGRYPVRAHIEHTPSLPTNGGEEWDAWIEVFRTCQWNGCEDDALPEIAARGRVAGSGGDFADVDLYLCGPHRDLIARGATSHVSIAVEATPARPA